MMQILKHLEFIHYAKFGQVKIFVLLLWISVEITQDLLLATTTDFVPKSTVQVSNVLLHGELTLFGTISCNM